MKNICELTKISKIENLVQDFRTEIINLIDGVSGAMAEMEESNQSVLKMVDDNL